MLGTVAGALIGSIVAQLVLRRPTAPTARRRRAPAAGQTFDVPVKVRLLDESGVGRRWREGVLYRVEGQLRFRPRRPRIGRRLDLSGLGIVGQRPSKPGERWWFAGRTVLLAETSLGPAEIATHDAGGPTLAADLVRQANDARVAEVHPP